MKDYNKYVKKWQDLSIKMNEAMQKDNFELADKLLKESTEAYERYKECSQLPMANKGKTFGELNYMLECELPALFKDNKKALKECISLIKSDPNLRSQFRFLESLRKYNCEGGAKDYVTESLNLAVGNIDKKSVRESLDKLGAVLAKHEIGNYQLDESEIKFYKACDKLMTESKTLGNLTDYTNALSEVSEYIQSHKAPMAESKANVITMSEALEKKLANLSEEDRSLVQDIIDFRNPIKEAKQEKIFNRFKNECLDTIKKLQESNNNSNDLAGLNSVKEQIEAMTYCKESIVQSIAKLLEVRDVLLEK